MRTIEKTVYKFNELSETAKEKAIENYRISNDDFEFRSGDIIYDCADIAELFGLDIRQTAKVNGKREKIYTPTVYYSGFCSQGDGACFDGCYSYSKKGALKAVKAYAPNDTELHGIVKNLQDIQKRYFYGLRANTAHRGRYYHEHCMEIDVEHIDGIDIPESVQEDLAECLRDFARWIYKRLETEYEYINTDEYISEELEVMDCEFYDDGEMI